MTSRPLPLPQTDAPYWQHPVWFAVGDHAVMLDFTGFSPLKKTSSKQQPPRSQDSRFTSDDIRTLADHIRSANLSGITEIVPSLTRLLIAFDPLITSSDSIKTQILPYLSQPTSLSPNQTALSPAGMSQNKPASRHWHLPICYDDEMGPDIDDLAATLSLPRDEVISRHLNSQLHVAVMGFLPGLGYMTGLDDALNLPRRANPRAHVPANAVGIAIGQCVIYPLASPGGWHLIGQVPFPMFDVHREDPILLSPGDKVSFARIDRATFDQHKTAYETGDLTAQDLIKGLIS